MPTGPSSPPFRPKESPPTLARNVFPSVLRSIQAKAKVSVDVADKVLQTSSYGVNSLVSGFTMLPVSTLSVASDPGLKLPTSGSVYPLESIQCVHWQVTGRNISQLLLTCTSTLHRRGFANYWGVSDLHGSWDRISLSPAIAQSIDPSDFVIRRSTYQPPTLMTNVSVGSDGSPGTQRILTRVDSLDDMARNVLATLRGLTH